MRITLEDIFNIPSAVIYYPDRYKSVTSVSIDTRNIKKNSIFVAIKGKNFDGHNYINDAIKKGAKAIVVNNRKLKILENVEVPIISVKNTLDAYGKLANIWRNKLSAKVISITGSNGKTTTKEMIAQLLSSKFKVHKTAANNNNQIGVPLTILSTPKDADIIVLEHGTNHFGEIAYTARIAEPDYAIITNIGNSHTEYLESKEKILSEKSALFYFLKDDGLAFINKDDALLKSLKIKNNISYGFKGRCDIKGKRIGVTKDSCEQLKIEGLGKNIEIKLPLMGEANSNNFLAAVSIAIKLGITKKDIIKNSTLLSTENGRLNKKEFNGFTLIDDTYNSNPESVKNALLVLKSFTQRSRKILVLGDMFELGNNSEKMHGEIAVAINKLRIDSVYTIGKASKTINDALTKSKDKKHFTNRLSLEKHLNKIDLIDAVILIKGSRGMKMEDFVNVIEKRAK